jgi:recombination protein RecA
MKSEVKQDVKPENAESEISKKKSLSSLIKGMKKNLKDDDYILLDEDGSIDDVTTFLPSGCTALDYLMSNRKNGGYPVGKIVEIAGPPHSGKTLLAIHACAEAQKAGALCVYLDPENAFNEDFAKRIGLDLAANSFWYVKPPPPTIESLFDFLFKLSNQIDELKKEKQWPFKYVLVIWDSVASSPPKQDSEQENPDPGANVGLIPRIISKNLRTFLNIAAKKDILLLCLNQLRNRISVMPGQDPWTTPGGNAIPFYSSVRLRIKGLGKIKDSSGEIIGVNTEVKVEKTRFGPPFRKAEFPIYFTHGVDDPECIINCLEEKKAVETINGGPKGKFIAFSGEPRENAIKKSEFKKLFLTDEKFKNKALDAFEKTMVKNLDPRFEENSISNTDE